MKSSHAYISTVQVHSMISIFIQLLRTLNRNGLNSRGEGGYTQYLQRLVLNFSKISFAILRFTSVLVSEYATIYLPEMSP